MKALSLWQPWASAIASDAKRIETRGWATAYRGQLAIHAAKRCVMQEMREYDGDPCWRAALSSDVMPLWEWLPFGAIVAVVELVDCRPTESWSEAELCVWRYRPWTPGAGYPGSRWCEGMLGNFAPGRYGWVLENVRKLPLPIAYRGAQGLFEIPDEVLR